MTAVRTGPCCLWDGGGDRDERASSCRATTALVVGAGAANAASFDFSYSILPFQGATPIVAKGLVEATDLGGFYTVDNVTGTRDGVAITSYEFFDDAPQSFNYANGRASNVDFLYRIGADTYEVRFPGNGSGFGSEFVNANMSALVTSFSLSPTAAAAVPEPATWATMIAGIGLVGVAMRSRRPTRTVAPA